MWTSYLLALGLCCTVFVDARPSSAVPCDGLEKYSVDYFFAAKRYEPAMSTCLFYTRPLSNSAMQFSKKSGGRLSTIWDLFPCNLYNASPTDNMNPLRCLMADETQKRMYFANMSKAMALSCDVSATVMTNDTRKIPLDGIWGVTELPALTGKGRGDRRVDWIEAIDPKGERAITIWERPERFGEAKAEAVQSSEMSWGRAQKVQASANTPGQVWKRVSEADHCPFVSAAQMERWWDDVNW